LMMRFIMAAPDEAAIPSPRVAARAVRSSRSTSQPNGVSATR
jgi:hypothetical protein